MTTTLTAAERRAALYRGACRFHEKATVDGPAAAAATMSRTAADAAATGRDIGYTADDVATWRVDFEREAARQARHVASGSD